MTGLLVTGIAPPIRDIFMDIRDAKEACYGKAGREILIDGNYFLAEPDPFRRIKLCIVAEITTIKTAGTDQSPLKGKWDEDGAGAEILIGRSNADLALKGSHSGLMPNGLGYFAGLAAIALPSLMISAIYAGWIVRRNRATAAPRKPDEAAGNDAIRQHTKAPEQTPQPALITGAPRRTREQPEQPGRLIRSENLRAPHRTRAFRRRAGGRV